MCFCAAGHDRYLNHSSLQAVTFSRRKESITTITYLEEHVGKLEKFHREFTAKCMIARRRILAMDLLSCCAVIMFLYIGSYGGATAADNNCNDM